MRATRDDVYLTHAKNIARRGTCLRRQVGCVLVDARGHQLSSGYNGVAAGEKHCNEELHEAPWRDACNELVLPSVKYPHACEGARAPSGQGLDSCKAIHAEQNALLFCADVFQIHTCYCTASPCITCVKLLMATSCHRIVFLEEYPHPEARKLWGHREWVHYQGEIK